MSKYQYDIINGQRVEKNVAAALRPAMAEFKAATGYDVIVTSGTRTEEEQQKGRNDYLAGRTKVKWADPKESSHCEIGPSGPRALDLRDSGPDAGITVKGSKRWVIWRDIAAKYGFTWGGWGVPDYEGWHFENHKVQVGVYDQPAPAPAPAVRQKIDPGVVLGWRWPGVAAMLRRYAGYRGNNTPGPIMISALQRWLNGSGDADRAIGRKLAVDGDFGPNTLRAVQAWLKRRWGYSGAIDADPGPGTHAAWHKAENENWKAAPAWAKQ